MSAAVTTQNETLTARHVRRRRWTFPRVPFLIACLCLLGVGILLYPSTAMWIAAKGQTGELDNYLAETNAIGPQARLDTLAAASAYNQELSGGMTSIAAGERIPQAGQPSSLPGYADQLRADDQGTMARIKVPSIGVDLPIYHGTSDAVLEKGIGHLEGTALPVGGKGTHSVLTGHRGLASAELFTRLNEVQPGQDFTIEVFGEVLTYRVSTVEVVAPDQTQTLYPSADGDQVTLVTCTPLGINSHRILVTGDRVLPTPAKDEATAGNNPNTAGFPWWALAGGAALVASTFYVWWSGRHPIPTS
ncbi:class C sortase [Cellulosimicrobium funkei]|nr:class C sortase [Cellulosimicrobium funkei]